MSIPSGVGAVIDRVIEAPIVTSFTNLGFHVRSRSADWADLSELDLAGRTMVITGGTSGIGRAAATRLASLGAHVIITGRGRERAEAVAAQINQGLEPARPERALGNVSAAAADLGDFDEVRALATELLGAHPSIDVLMHNAGALTADRHTNPDGLEATIASQVYGPFLLTALLLPALRASATGGRVITMSSGGMYSATLAVAELEMPIDDYGGSEQYARAKRAQVTLNEMWPDRVADSGVVFHAMHPGWADTPGVEASLPRFRKIVGPLLRSPEQGADTMVWLAADPEPATSTGQFWLDRHTRSIHKLPATRRSDTPEQRERLWQRCVDVTGIDPSDRRSGDAR